MCTVYCIQLALVHFIISANSFRVHCFCKPLCTHALSFFTLVSLTHTPIDTPCVLHLALCQLVNALLYVYNCKRFYGHFQRWCFIAKCFLCNCQISIVSFFAGTPPQLQSFIANFSGSRVLIRKKRNPRKFSALCIIGIRYCSDIIACLSSLTPPRWPTLYFLPLSC